MCTKLCSTRRGGGGTRASAAAHRVRFLIDECLPPFLGAVLRSAGHDAVAVAALDLCGVPDSIVMATAREQRRVLVSAYTDFGEILARSNDRQPSVVLSEAARSSMRRRSGRFC